jgi:hypothetical protein
MKHRSAKLTSLPNSERARMGMSIVEVLAASALATIVMGTILTFAHGLLQWDRTARVRMSRGPQLDRLADDLRAEIRRAAAVDRTGEAQLEIVSTDGRRATFDLTPQGCERADVAADGTTSRRELYAIGTGRAWQIEQSMDGVRPLVTVKLLRTADAAGASSPASPLVVTATLGANAEVKSSDD